MKAAEVGHQLQASLLQPAGEDELQERRSAQLRLAGEAPLLVEVVGVDLGCHGVGEVESPLGNSSEKWGQLRALPFWRQQELSPHDSNGDPVRLEHRLEIEALPDPPPGAAAYRSEVILIDLAAFDRPKPDRHDRGRNRLDVLDQLWILDRAVGGDLGPQGLEDRGRDSGGIRFLSGSRLAQDSELLRGGDLLEVIAVQPKMAFPSCWYRSNA